MAGRISGLEAGRISGRVIGREDGRSMGLVEGCDVGRCTFEPVKGERTGLVPPPPPPREGLAVGRFISRPPPPPRLNSRAIASVTEIARQQV